ncbi:SGNH/GDSL hydrolase family protein [Streptomyces sp. NPDC012794]|uniref:SGNH/GDSL hydrolase family protein n=1 Tax=Streptomyces sp. NPDC012794 TaxID=3364850 RepID=UPI003688F2BC
MTASLIGLVGCVPTAVTPCPTTSDTARPAIRIMPLGDSITQGVGSTTGGGYRLPLEESLRRVGVNVDFVGSQKDGPLVDPDHEGHSGYLIDQIADSVEVWLAHARPDVILLHAGINDLARGPMPAQAADRMLALIHRIHDDAPRTVILVQGLIPTTAGLQARVRAFNDRIGGYGRDYVYVEPPALNGEQMTDQLHPNDGGYQRLAAVFSTPLAQAMRQTPPGCEDPPPLR